MPVLFIETLPKLGEEFEVKDHERLKHFKALRVCKGELMSFFCPGFKILAEVVDVSPRSFLFRTEEISDAVFPKPRITLLQGVIDKQSLENIVRINVPLFVMNFVFFRAKRSNHILSEQFIQRLCKISLSVAEQSEVCFIPQISYKDNLKSTLDTFDFGKTGVFMLDPSSGKKLSDFLNELSSKEEICFLVGPEGGFAPEELKAITDMNINAVRIPSGVFRSEIAGFAASILLRELTS